MEDFRPPKAPGAAVTCKASTERGGWSPAPIGQNTKAETYPGDAGRGGAAAGARGPFLPEARGLCGVGVTAVQLGGHARWASVETVR